MRIVEQLSIQRFRGRLMPPIAPKGLPWRMLCVATTSAGRVGAVGNSRLLELECRRPV